MTDHQIATSVLVFGEHHDRTRRCGPRRDRPVRRSSRAGTLERRETRGCHNRADHPELDESLRVNLAWSGPGRVEREGLPPIPAEITSLMREVSTVGKLVE